MRGATALDVPAAGFVLLRFGLGDLVPRAGMFAVIIAPIGLRVASELHRPQSQRVLCQCCAGKDGADRCGWQITASWSVTTSPGCKSHSYQSRYRLSLPRRSCRTSTYRSPVTIAFAYHEQHCCRLLRVGLARDDLSVAIIV